MFYDDFLEVLKDEKYTDDDSNCIRFRCSNHPLSNTEWKESVFYENNVTSFFYQPRSKCRE